MSTPLSHDGTSAGTTAAATPIAKMMPIARGPRIETASTPMYTHITKASLRAIGTSSTSRAIISPSNTLNSGHWSLHRARMAAR